MNHGDVDVPLCMNILFGYAVLLFNNVYEIFLGILPCAIFSQNASVCFSSVQFGRNTEIFHILIYYFQISSFIELLFCSKTLAYFHSLPGKMAQEFNHDLIFNATT